MNRPLKQPLTFLLLLLFICPFLISSSTNSKLESAKQLFRAAEFEAAIASFEAVANNEALDNDTRVEALWYLSRCYIAKRETETAKKKIVEILLLEPPPFEPDPDREPPALLRVYYQARKETLGDMQLAHKDPGVQTMAVADFKNRSFVKDRADYDPLEKGFSEIIINHLDGSTNLDVVERDRIQWVFDELDIQDRYNMSGAVRAGKLLGVHVVVLGSFILQKKDKVQLLARAVKVETGEIIYTADVKGKIDDFYELAGKLSNEIAKNVKAEAPDLSEESAPNSLEALITYAEGLELLEQERYDEAYQKFEEALEHDPGYAKASEKAEGIRYLTAYAGR